MEIIRYTFDNYTVRKNKNSFQLINSNENVSKKQRILFELMLNIGHVAFQEGPFLLSENDILTFWEEEKNELLKNIDATEYYHLLDLPDFYTARKPYIKPNGAPHSTSFSMTIVWPVSVNSFGPVEPLAYKKEGVILKDFDGKVLGSVCPEYLQLYKIIDEANESWSEKNPVEIKEFVRMLKDKSSENEFFIPQTFNEVIGR